MKIYTSLDDFKQTDDVVLSMGMFDGVHLAHRQVLREVTEKARALKALSVVLSFSPHPREVLSGKPFPLILTFPEKRELLEMADIDIWVCMPFTHSLAALSAEEFWEMLGRKMTVRQVVLGYNHGFGKGKQGNAQMLAKKGEVAGFGITELPRLQLGNLEISSSVIREALLAGDVVTANRLLGYPFFADLAQAGLQMCDSSENSGSQSVSLTLPAEKLLPEQGDYSARWNQQKVIVEIIDNQKIILNFNGNAPSEETLRRHPLYFIKQI